MSVPHTGRLIALVDGLECHFDGDRWRTPDDALTARLDRATAEGPRHHYSIKELAESAVRRAGLAHRYRLVAWRGDVWPAELPDGAVD